MQPETFCILCMCSTTELWSLNNHKIQFLQIIVLNFLLTPILPGLLSEKKTLAPNLPQDKARIRVSWEAQVTTELHNFPSHLQNWCNNHSIIHKKIISSITYIQGILNAFKCSNSCRISIKHTAMSALIHRSKIKA